MSREASYAVRAAVTVVEVSRTIRGIPCEVRLGARDGLPRSCAANADNVVTIPKPWLESLVAPLRPDKAKALVVISDAERFPLATMKGAYVRAVGVIDETAVSANQAGPQMVVREIAPIANK